MEAILLPSRYPTKLSIFKSVHQLLIRSKTTSRSVEQPIAPNILWGEHFFKKRKSSHSSLTTDAHSSRYLVVNYEQSNFSVSQNIWKENAPTEILAIDAANSTKPPNITKVQTKSNAISTGAIIGIAVAAVVLIILAAVAAFFCIRRRRKRRKEKAKVDEVELFQKPEMDGTGKGPVGELYAEGKSGEVDSSSKVEMQGSEVKLSAYDKNRAEMEGTRGGAEMAGTSGGVEMQGSRLNAEMDGTGTAPVEMYAGPHGLYELPSPPAAEAEGSDVPSPLGGSRRTRRSGVASWSRRQKPTPSLPQSESSGISPDSEDPDRRSGASIWTARRARDTASHQDISSPISESSRNRQRSRGDLLTQRLESASRSKPPPEISSPRDSSRERPRRTREGTYTRNTAASSTSDGSNRDRLDRGADAWNQRFGTTPQSLTPNDISSPSDRSRRGRDRLGSAASGGSAGEVSSPSNSQTPSRGSPQPPGNFF